MLRFARIGTSDGHRSGPITTPSDLEDADAALRPKSLDEFIGQQAARENVPVIVSAAKSRGEAVEHID